MLYDYQIKEIWFIHHGESIGNAGFATSNPATIPLTHLGHQQARYLSKYIKLEPDLIVTSPYTRTFQTAAPTVKQFHQAKQEEWNIQEFTYLAPGRCINTTVEERKDMVYDFWVLSDPNYIDGDGAESLSQLISRIQSMWQKLHQIESGSNILVFTHGLFMNAIRWTMAKEFAPLTQLYMTNFHDFHLTWPIPNCGILKCRLDTRNQAQFQGAIDDFVSKKICK